MSDLVGNPEDRFSRDTAQLQQYHKFPKFSDRKAQGKPRSDFWMSDLIRVITVCVLICIFSSIAVLKSFRVITADFKFAIKGLIMVAE